MLAKIQAFYSLTKPGVLYGNVITAVAGFLFASSGVVDWGLFVSVIIGTSLVIASACVLNNYLDQDIDSKMERTKKRAIVNGDVSPLSALFFAILLLAIGMFVLVAYTNYLVVATGVIGYLTYVWLYGAWSKRLSVHGTLVGSISGAMPILAGYLGARGQLDIGALLVFLAVFFWQMPEFYSIAIYRLKEYARAKVPVMPVIKGIPNTVIQIFVYTVLFVASVLALSFAGYTSYTYLVIMSLMGLRWLWLGWQGIKVRNQPKLADAWSRKMFHYSLIFLVSYSLLLSVDWLLP